MPEKIEPGAIAQFGFNTPFAEQIAFFRQKLNLPTEHWDDIMRAAHDRAFVVAGAMKADLLADLHGAVGKVIGEGKSIGWFRKKFAAIVGEHGWQGWTGEGSPEGFAWRTRVIYQTNLATSYAAGRYQQLTDPELLTLRPYWRYKHADGVANPRLQHVAWNGLTLPHDHPFWQTHFPPNGWGCHCRVVAVNAKEFAKAQAAGLAEPPEGWGALDEKTGEPAGIAQGFGYAPGATWKPFDKNAFTPECGGPARQAAFAEGSCIRAAAGQNTFADLGLPRIRDVAGDLRHPAPPLLGRAASRPEALAQLAGVLGVSPDLPRRWVDTNISGPALSRLLIEYGYLAHMVEKDADARERYANFVLPTLIDPFEAWATLYSDGTIRPRLIGLFEGKKQMALVLRLNRDGSFLYNMMQADDKRLDDFRVGALLHGK